MVFHLGFDTTSLEGLFLSQVWFALFLSVVCASSLFQCTSALVYSYCACVACVEQTDRARARASRAAAAGGTGTDPARSRSLLSRMAASALILCLLALLLELPPAAPAARAGGCRRAVA